MHYHSWVSWDVFFTETAEQWLDVLSNEDFDRVIAAADLLSDRGPGLGRPTVHSITSSRHANMKELRTGMLRACSPSIRSGARSCWSEATSAAIGRAGMSATSPSPTIDLTCTSVRKD